MTKISLYPTLLLYTAIVFGSFYLFYITSDRAAVSALPLRHWAKNNASISKALGGLLLLAAFVLYLFESGFGAGFFYALAALMAAASLMIILVPLPWNFSKKR